MDEQDEFEDVMNTAEKAIRNFIEDKPVGYKIYEMEPSRRAFMGSVDFATIC